MFAENKWDYTGMFRIFNAADPAKQWILATGDENSEVILVEGTALVYRVADSVWQAELGQDGTIQNAKRLATDPSLQDAHWAFFGAKE